MRSMYKVALVVCALALAVCALGAGPALAAESPEWYSSSTAPTTEWQQAKAKISEAAATKSKGTVMFRDLAVDAAVECTSTSEGSAGPGAAGKQTSWTLSSCVAPAKAKNKSGQLVTNACEKGPASAEMTGLPWHVELVGEGSALHEVISAEGKTAPGFTMTCEAVVGKVTDKCVSEKSPHASVGNVTGGVDATFGGEPLFKCTVGGKESGTLEGTQLNEAVKGGKLEANIAEGTYSKVTSALAVKGTGELAIEEHKSVGAGARCPVTAEGVVEAGGKGKITSYTVGQCVGLGTCQTVTTVNTLETPWKTELAESGGRNLDKILSGGWSFTCGGDLWMGTDSCSIAVSPKTVNNAAGGAVDLVFNEELTKTKCKYDEGSENEYGVWSGELKLAPTTGAIQGKG